MHVRGALAIGLIVAAASLAAAQPAPIPSREVQPLIAELPPDRAPRIETQAPTEELLVSVPGAHWIRLLQLQADFPPGAYARITSLADGASQRLDIEALRVWSDTSAYFNGSELAVQLFAPAGGVPVLKIGSVSTDVSAGPPSEQPRSICADDDRVHSTDRRVGRIVPVGCTGWLVTNGAGLSAGHCVQPDPGEFQVIEFNVPASLCDGTIQHPPPQDQYPIEQASIVAQYDPQGGNDWCLFRPARNTDTGLLAAERQGEVYRVVGDADDPRVRELREVRISGFGVDKDPQGCSKDPLNPKNAQSQTNQTDAGPFDSQVVIDANHVVLSYTVDTEPGNSGSPVAVAGTAVTLGIHTSGGCAKYGVNKGTGFKNAALSAALEAFAGPRAVHVDPEHLASLPESGSFFEPYRMLKNAIDAAASGSTLCIAAGFYEGRGVAFPLGKELTLIAPIGDVVIGPYPAPIPIAPPAARFGPAELAAIAPLSDTATEEKRP